MKKSIIFLVPISLLSLVSCGNKFTEDNLLPHFSPTTEKEEYETEILYKNLSQFWGGDSGIIWVSKEQSPEYGGYFYQYMSGCAGVFNGDLSTGAVPTAFTPEGRPYSPSKGMGYDYTSMIACSRSKDLNDWELCGAVDNGFCLKILPNEWVYSSTWAPECVYDKVTKRYYLYFSGKSKINDGSIEGAHYSNDDSGAFSRFYLSVAVSESPCGPFTLVNSADYNSWLGITGDLNKNGDVVNGINPTIDPGYYFKNNSNSIYRDQLKDVEYPIWSAIDPSPFFDENGDLYLYCSNHGSNISAVKHKPINDDPNSDDYDDGSSHTHEVWGFKMKDMITPDYESMRVVIPSVQSHANAGQFERYNSYTRVEYKGEMPGKSLIDYPPYETNSYKRYLSWNDNDPMEKWNIPSNTNDWNNDGNIVEGPQMITTKDSSGKTVYILTYAPLGVGAPQYDVKWTYSYNPMKGFIKPKGRSFAAILGLDDNNNFMTNLGHAAIINVDNEWWISHWEYPEPFSSWDTGRIHAVTRMTWVDNVEGYNFPIPSGNGPTKSCQAKPSVSTGYHNISPEANIKASNDSKKYLNDDLVVTSIKWMDRLYEANTGSKIELSFDTPRSVRGLLVHNSYDYSKAFKELKNVMFTLEDGSVKGIPTLGLDGKYLTLESDETNGYIEPGLAAVATFAEIKVKSISFEVPSTLSGGNVFNISEIEVLGK